MPKISIITVNYNSSEDTIQMVNSIKSFTTIDYEIIIIDNGSSYEEYEKLLDINNDNNNIVLHRSRLNLGFAGGNILGTKYISNNSKYYFFLNNDTLFINNVMDILYQTMEDNLDIGLISPQLYDKDNNFSTTFREFPTVSEKYFGKAFHKLISFKKIYNSKQFYSSLIDVGIVSGASLFFRKTTYNLISGFDKQFFLYCEEEDLSKRVHNINQRVCLEPKAKLIHLGGQSTKRNFLIEREFIISYFYLIEKHYDKLRASLLKSHITLKYFFKRKKNPINYKLYLFCKTKNKEIYSLKYMQKELNN
jgi:hypothetical protein